MVEFYMHNIILTDMNQWDPNSRLGYMQLMALAYWVAHEEIRDEEVKRVMEKEELLYIISKLMRNKDFITNHSLISNYDVVSPKYIET